MPPPEKKNFLHISSPFPPGSIPIFSLPIKTGKQLQQQQQQQQQQHQQGRRG